MLTLTRMLRRARHWSLDEIQWYANIQAMLSSLHEDKVSLLVS